MMIVDNFCPRFEELQKEAAEAKYKTVNHGTIFYGGISLKPPAMWAYEKFQALLGRPVKPVIEYFRKYERGMEQNGFIHSDHGVSDWTAVLSLRNDNGALCLWRHLALGWIKPDPEQPDALIQAAQDGIFPERWHLIHQQPMNENLCVIYPAALFHSRWPQEWNEDHARMIQVFFFNVL
jgi:hypothetical protein